MKTVAATDTYTIRCDQSKNRVYFAIVGSWKSRSDVPNYIADWKKALGFVSPGFTILSDLRQMKAMLVHDLHVEAQQLLVDAGLKKTGEVVDTRGIATRAQLGEISKDSGMVVRRFATMEEAEAWLDES